MTDDNVTRDVSACERLILLVRYVYYQYEQGELEDNAHLVKWSEIDRLKGLCDVLPKDFQHMLQTIEQYRT